MDLGLKIFIVEFKVGLFLRYFSTISIISSISIKFLIEPFHKIKFLFFDKVLNIEFVSVCLLLFFPII